MRARRRWLIAGAVVLALPAVALTAPGAVACALVELAPLDRLPDGTLVDAALPEATRAQVHVLRSEAARRISSRLGEPIAAPTVLVLSAPDAWPPFTFNPYGSTSFIGSRACVVIGPSGTNVDVVAHELVHAELFARVGAWRRAWLPTWLDEGVAMQVDDRPRYWLNAPLSEDDQTLARTLDTPGRFFVADDAQLTRNYALAKALAREWLATHDPWPR